MLVAASIASPQALNPQYFRGKPWNLPSWLEGSATARLVALDAEAQFQALEFGKADESSVEFEHRA